MHDHRATAYKSECLCYLLMRAASAPRPSALGCQRCQTPARQRPAVLTSCVSWLMVQPRVYVASRGDIKTRNVRNKKKNIVERKTSADKEKKTKMSKWRKQTINRLSHADPPTEPNQQRNNRPQIRH